jgi:hypothetical protein
VAAWANGGDVTGRGALWAGSFNPDLVGPTGGVWRVKIGWYRVIEGRLEVRAVRDDGSGAASGDEVSARVPDGYGDDGFQTSLLELSAGCWHVTGALDGQDPVEMWVPVGR